MKGRYLPLLLSISIAATTLFSASTLSGTLTVPNAYAQLESTIADQVISSINQAKVGENNILEDI